MDNEQKTEVSAPVRARYVDDDLDCRAMVIVALRKHCENVGINWSDVLNRSDELFAYEHTITPEVAGQ
jgi:hypothetical protein